MAVGIAVIALLGFSLRDAPVLAIWATVRTLKAWQVLLVLAVDATIYVLIGGRWWLIVKAEDTKARLFPITAIRLAAFAISYFTFGPQIGGEPLQVLYLRGQYRATYARATSTVVLDKLLELLVNSLLLVLSLAALVRAGLLAGMPIVEALSFPLLGGIAAWPVIHLTLLWRGRLPLSAVVALMPILRKDGRPARFIRVAERLAGQFCTRHPRPLLLALGVSALAGAATVIEYALVTSYLGIRLTPWQTVAGWSAGWLSFLTPLPGGLGALEASQVLTLGTFGVPAAAAIAVTLLMRARDVSLAGLGLLIMGGFGRILASRRLADDVLSGTGEPAKTDLVGR